MRFLLLGLTLLATAFQLHAQSACPPDPLRTDFGQLARYRDADLALPAPKPGEPRVIFYGDSITDGWHLDQYFPAHQYINRGISGQTTAQMLVRFRQDVIDLAPAVVVVLAGTNDLAGNTGPVTVPEIEANLATMAELARVHNIHMVLSSVTPVYGTIVGGRPPAKILALDAWIREYAATNHLVYLDYFSAMVDSSGHLKQDLSDDGLHPNALGYKIMAPLAQQAITTALKQ